MDSEFVFTLCTFLAWFSSAHAHAQNRIFPVTEFGAVSDGATDNSMAFSTAWKIACAIPGATVSVPSGTYAVRGASFEGPCNGDTSFQNRGTIRAFPGAHDQDSWISFYNLVGLRIYGRGTFDGNGASTWSTNINRPMSIKISKVTNLAIEGVTSLNSKYFHFHIALCENVVMHSVRILAPEGSPNTDGIHVARSAAVKICNAYIATGDDCVSIGDGSENIEIESVACVVGHGFSIGSLGRYSDEKDVKGIRVRNCNLTDTKNGLRIKTLAPSSVSTRVYNVTFENINVRNVKNPIIIDQYYCPDGSGCSHWKDSEIKIEGVKFVNVKGTSSSAVGIELKCSKSVPCQNLEFEGVRLRSDGGGSTAVICSSSSANYRFVDANQNPRTCGNAPDTYLSR